MDFALGLALSIVNMLLFGFSNFIMVKGSRTLGPFRTTLWFQAVTLALFALLSPFLFSYAGFSSASWLLLVFTGLISAIGILSFMKGLAIGNASVVSMIGSGRGAVTAVLGIILLGEVITPLRVGYLAIIVIGTLLLSLDLRSIIGSRKSRFASRGVSYAVLTLFSWGLYFFLISFLSQTLGYFATGMFATLFTVVFLGAYGFVTKAKMVPGSGSYRMLLVLGVLNVAALITYNIAVTYTYTAVVAPISAAAPIIVVILAPLLLGERLALDQKVGVAMVLIGIALLAA